MKDGLPLTTQKTTTAGNGDGPAGLVARIEAGERRAEEELVARYGRAIRIVLDRHTGGRPEAEDLFQDTFAVALGKLRRGELRDPAKLPGFLSRIARNLAIELYRKAQRRATDADSETVDRAVAGDSSQLGELLRSEHAALVRRVIEELGNDRDRQLLFRFYVAEEDKDEIAADLGLSSLQFNRVLYRARQRYKELYLKRATRVGMAAMVLWGAIVGLLVPLR
jgi:RNA polymerase sigma-70 factor (ECF subfamily)